MKKLHEKIYRSCLECGTACFVNKMVASRVLCDMWTQSGCLIITAEEKISKTMKTCLLCGKEMTPLSGDVIMSCDACDFHAAYDAYTGALVSAWWNNHKGNDLTNQIYIRAVEGTLLIFSDEKIPFGHDLRDRSYWKELSAIQAKEDKAIFDAIKKAGRPEGCVAVWEDERL